MHTLPPCYDLPPLARLETNWCPPWLIARVAQHGPWHYGNGKPMDDSHVVGSVGDCFWMAAADGVGSQPNSRFGSSIACRALDAFLGHTLTNGAAPSRRLLVDAFKAAHDAIHALATSEKMEAFTLSTTLVATLITGNTVIAAAVGDSGIAVATSHEDERGHPVFRLTPFCSAPQPGNATFTIADPNWLNYVATNESIGPHITHVLVATDGANSFFLRNGQAFQNDWPEAIADRVRELTPLTYVNFFAHFIQHQPPENFDDRTLLVAYRTPSDSAPPASKSR